MWYQKIIAWLDRNPLIQELIIVSGVLLLCYLSYFVTKKIILKWISKGLERLVVKTKSKFDDIVLKNLKLERLAYIPPLLIAYSFANVVPKAAQAIHRISYALIFLIIIQTIHAFFNALIEFTETDPKFKGKPLKGYIQILTLMLYIIAILVIIAILTGQSPWVLLSGIGALTAVILLIFRETILSFVASLQISSYKLVKKNDWIEAPQYGADGDVIDISLHTVKVQNWDKTITVIPTHKLIEGSFKNWRGMEECGGRRIKRSFYIDINSIRFCDKKMVEKFKKVSLLKDYIEQKQNEIDAYNREKGIDLGIKINGRRLTNVGTFRAYIQAYLKDHHQINHNLTFLIRQLQSGPTGLPIEIYVFTNTIEWVQYEAIQADIFDHILAVAKEFDLKIFQYPSDNSANKVVFADPN